MQAISHLIAGVPVSDLDAGIDWYTRFFGRPPDLRVGEEILWDVDEHATLFIEPDAARAGAGRITFAGVALDSLLEQLAAQGIEHELSETDSDGARYVKIPDPDGNAIAFAELPDAVGSLRQPGPAAPMTSAPVRSHNGIDSNRRPASMTSDPTAQIDRRFSDPEAGPTPWSAAVHVLEHAELYWLTTVRADGRPHVTPLIGVARDGAVHFCTGLREQKARNLERSAKVALTTGNNAWDRGLDVVVEGTAVRVSERDALQELADAYEAKYGSVWHFEVGDGVFGAGEDAAAVYRIEPAKVLAFAKEPHAQTTYRVGAR